MEEDTILDFIEDPNNIITFDFLSDCWNYFRLNNSIALLDYRNNKHTTFIATENQIKEYIEFEPLFLMILKEEICLLQFISSSQLTNEWSIVKDKDKFYVLNQSINHNSETIINLQNLCESLRKELVIMGSIICCYLYKIKELPTNIIDSINKFLFIVK